MHVTLRPLATERACSQSFFSVSSLRQKTPLTSTESSIVSACRSSFFMDALDYPLTACFNAQHLETVIRLVLI